MHAQILPGQEVRQGSDAVGVQQLLREHGPNAVHALKLCQRCQPVQPEVEECNAHQTLQATPER